MGALFDFKCKGCEYTAEVAGAETCGVILITITILCLDCECLYDVETGTRSRAYVNATHREPRCPKRKGHRIRKWEYPDVCPKCGGEMGQSGIRCLWD